MPTAKIKVINRADYIINRADLLRLSRSKRIMSWFRRHGFYISGYQVTLFYKTFTLFKDPVETPTWLVNDALLIKNNRKCR